MIRLGLAVWLLVASSTAAEGPSPATAEIKLEWHGLCHAGENAMFKSDCDADRRWSI